MKLNETYLGKWLSLIRIQSTPVTVLTLCLGYATVAQSVTNVEVVWLAVVGSMGHWGFYALNDVMDYEYDKRHKDESKPLVCNSIKRAQASIASTLFILLSLFIAWLVFTPMTLLWYVLAMFTGAIYNIKSKEHVFSGLYLSVWGAVIVLTGASYAGEPNPASYALAFAIAVHMIAMTIIGDIKDYHSGEPSIPRMLDVKLYYRHKRQRIFMSRKMILLWHTLNLLESLLIIEIALSATKRYEMLYYMLIITVAAIALKTIQGSKIFMTGIYEPDEIKRDIVLYTVLTVIAYIIAFTSHLTILNITLLIAGSVVWGLGWQKIQYGRALYFP